MVVDMDACPESVRRWGVRAAPTRMVFRDGRKEGVQAGAAPKEKVLALVDRAGQRAV